MKKGFKKIFYIFLFLLLGGFFLMGIFYLINSNSQAEDEFLTRQPIVGDMEEKVMATGEIVPLEEIEIKPNLAGIIDKIYVDEGDEVKVGQLVASLKIVPSIQSVNNAQQEVNNANLQISIAKINLENQQKQFAIQQKLYDEGVIARQEFLTAQLQLENHKTQLKNAQFSLQTASKNLQIAKTGVTPELQNLATTQIRSKVNGVVLEVPIKVGSQVIEANSFNAGTTIASVANLESLIFKGKIDEAQVGKLKQGMPMNIIIGALENKKFPGKLTMIAPKGKDESGTIKFPVEGAVYNPENEYIRAGFSANAEVVLKSEKNVLMIDESLLQYEKKNGKETAFVEVKQKDGTFKKVFLNLGHSNGLYVQVLSGVDKNSEIKVWNPSDKDKEELAEKKGK